MTSERPYRPAYATEDAAAELRREAGRQFRSDVVEALLRAV
jgi:HD-GYP domain-containing protein (c-di-GMP phosphodiesterase class II)